MEEDSIRYLPILESKCVRNDNIASLLIVRFWTATANKADGFAMGSISMLFAVLSRSANNVAPNRPIKSQ